MESINLTVREGDSFDELFLAFQKPVGTSRDFTGSELIAQIKDAFGASTVTDTFAITKLPTTGHLKLALSASQTEALARDIESGYTERELLYGVPQRAADPVDAERVFLWDLKELFYIDAGAGVSGISAGTVVDAALNTNKIRVTTSGDHGLGVNDIVRIAGTSVAGYNTTYTTNTLTIVDNTTFEINPTSGAPLFSSVASGGTVKVLKEDTIVIGTLKVKPRITSI